MTHQISYEIIRQGDSIEVLRITDKQFYRLINSVVIVRDDRVLADIAVEYFKALGERNGVTVDYREM